LALVKVSVPKNCQFTRCRVYVNAVSIFNQL
jgi:hypothetical protein